MPDRGIARSWYSGGLEVVISEDFHVPGRVLDLDLSNTGLGRCIVCFCTGRFFGQSHISREVPVFTGHW